jgi:hypothetical protein
LFFDDSELPSPTVTSLCLTSRKSGNHFNVPAKKKSPWSSDPDRQQLDDHQRNLALLATVRRSTGEDSSSSSSSSSTSKTKGSNKTEVEEKKPWENDTEQLSIDDLAKKLRVDKSVLEELIQADEATLEELQEFDAKTFHAVYMNQ